MSYRLFNSVGLSLKSVIRKKLLLENQDFIFSDKSIRIFEVNNDKTTYLTSFTTHDGPVWQLSWAHPKFGPILASAGFDKKVKIAYP